MVRWKNLTKNERREYMMFQMAPSYISHSAYLPDDCSECPVCSQPGLGSGLCRYCSDRFQKLIDKLNGKEEAK